MRHISEIKEQIKYYEGTNSEIMEQHSSLNLNGNIPDYVETEINIINTKIKMLKWGIMQTTILYARLTFYLISNARRSELSMFCYCCFMSTLLVFLTLSTMLLSWETMRPTMLTGEAGTILPALLIGVGP